MESKSYDDRSERGKIKFCNTVVRVARADSIQFHRRTAIRKGRGVAGGGAPRSVNLLPDMMKILRATGPGAFKALPVENTTDCYTVYVHCKAGVL